MQTYSENEADDHHSGRGHDFGAVGHQVEQRGHDAFSPVVKFIPQQ